MRWRMQQQREGHLAPGDWSRTEGWNDQNDNFPLKYEENDAAYAGDHVYANGTFR
jgi:hypothetical protein